MYCPKCGTEYEGNYCPNGCNSPQNTAVPAQPKKKKLKVWQIILIVLGAFIVVGGIGSALSQDEGPDGSTPANGTESQVSLEAEEMAPPEGTSTLTYEEEIATYQAIDFETLARNPDSYKGQKLTMTGEVIQVAEPTFGDTVELRINVTKQTYEYIDDVTWTDTIYATVKIPDGNDRILEGDIITFYGTCDGLYSYTSVLGASVSLPKIDIKYWNLNQ